MSDIAKFLKKQSGKIVGVGDIFDYSRSSIVGETYANYLERTKPYHDHIKMFIHGNHDSMFLKAHHFLPQCRRYRNKNVLAIHGHQLIYTFDQSRILKYEHRWHSKLAQASLFWDCEEWVIKVFNKYFIKHGKKAYAQALSVLTEIDQAGLIDSDEIDTVIVGHTHLPFDVEVGYKGRKIRVANCGSATHGGKFNPIYVKEIDTYFVSDLHLGTSKSKLN